MSYKDSELTTSTMISLQASQMTWTEFDAHASGFENDRVCVVVGGLMEHDGWHGGKATGCRHEGWPSITLPVFILAL